MNVIAHIRSLTEKGVEFKDIPDHLGEGVEIPIPGELPPQTALAIVRSISQVQKSQQAQLDQLRADIAKLTQALEQQRRPWWKRLRGKW